MLRLYKKIAMKRHLSFILLLSCALVSAQNINDVLKYSTEDLQGTARYQGMGGAFGALGGDLSALNINPAGSAVFNNTLITFSGTYYNTDNQANYFGTRTSSNVGDTNINQVGGVFVFNNTNTNSDWKPSKKPAAFPLLAKLPTPNVLPDVLNCNVEFCDG